MGMSTDEKLDPALLTKALTKSLSIAEKRAEKEVLWREVYDNLRELARLDVFNNIKGGERPTRFLKKIVASKAVPTRVAEAVATVFGEALYALTLVPGELIVVRGEEVRTWYRRFNGVQGLASCVTGLFWKDYLDFYAHRDDLVSLWVLLDQKGNPIARALYWEGVRVKEIESGTWLEGQKVLDRVYATSEGAKEKLIELAREAGAWHRSDHSWRVLDRKTPLVGLRGTTSLIARVPLGWSIEQLPLPDKVRFPHMDTFRYLFQTKEGEAVFSTRPPKSGPYVIVRPDHEPRYGFDNYWKSKNWRGAEGSEEIEDEGVPRCFVCGEFFRSAKELFTNEKGELYCINCEDVF